MSTNPAATAEPAKPAASACSRCRAIFTCGMVAGQPACWCAQLPRLQQIDAAATCLCPACLQLALRAQEHSTETA